MADLNLSGPEPTPQPAPQLAKPAPTQPAPAPAPTAPGGLSLEAPTDNALVLAAPAPVPAVQEEQAVGSIPVPDEKKAQLQQLADTFVNELAGLDHRSPEFSTKLNSIVSMGDADFRKSAQVSNNMLQRPAVEGSPSSPQAKVGKTLIELRQQITELDPKREDLRGVKKVLKFLPGGNKIDAYFNRYRSAQNHLDAIVRALSSGQDELRKDNASIDMERKNMWDSMGKLSEYNVLATALDQSVTQKVAELQAAGQAEAANAMNADVLFAVRQRRQDIMTQMAVAVQGYLALDMVKKNNVELIKGVDRAQTTTLSALRTAVIVSQALSQQKLVLDQITALNATTSGMIERTAEMLQQQGAQIQQQAASSMIDVDSLERAFTNVFQAMDEIDSFKAQANQSMSTTITALEGQIQRAKPYLERSARADSPQR